MPRSLLVFPVLALALFASLAGAQTDPLARFDDPLGELNRMVPRADNDERADLMLGRALTETDPMPATLNDLETIGLLVPGDGEWDAAFGWATGEKQKAALEVFKEATDRRAGNVFALPYGDAAPADLRAEGFGVSFVDGKLYQPEFEYMEHLARLEALVWVEANRLAEAGEGMDAAELMTGLVRLGRMLADRPMYEEAASGYVLILNSCEMLRDLVYRHPDLLDDRSVKRINRLLEDRTLRLDRLLFPGGREIAVKQAILDAYERMGDADPAEVSAIASLGGLEEAGGEPVGYFEAVDIAQRVFADWNLRWPLNPYDIIMVRPSFYTSLYEDAGRHAVVLATALPHDLIFELRRRTRAELAGTKISLGVAAYANDFGSLPKPITAIRPAYISDIDTDPYDVDEADQMRYFVPIRDQEWSDREAPHPHTISVHVGLDDAELTGMATAPTLRVISDERAVEVMREYTAAITSRDIGVHNLRSKLAGMEADALRAVLPANIRSRTTGLEARALRELASVIIGSTLVTPEFGMLRSEWGESPNSDDRRRRRSRRQKEPSRELISEARRFAIGLAEVGVPMTRRLQREQTGDPNVAMFDVTLDESDFVVYSIGKDGNFDWAVESGLDGTDILFWPPLLSLYREHTGG